MTIVTPRDALSTAELCRRLNRGEEFVEHLLQESAEQDVVERVGPDRWRLTDHGERRFGWALRSFAGGVR